MPLLSYQIQFLLFNCWVNFFLGVGNASNDINLIFSVYSALLRKNFKWIYWKRANFIVQTVWDGGVYPLTIEFSEDYPTKPPLCKCNSYEPTIHKSHTSLLEIGKILK